MLRKEKNGSLMHYFDVFKSCNIKNLIDSCCSEALDYHYVTLFKKPKKRECQNTFMYSRWQCRFFCHISRASNIAFLLDIAQMSDLDFGLIQQNISIKKASFQYQGRPLSFKSCKLWLNSYIFRIRIPSN